MSDDVTKHFCQPIAFFSETFDERNPETSLTLPATTFAVLNLNVIDKQTKSHVSH